MKEISCTVSQQDLQRWHFFCYIYVDNDLSKLTSASTTACRQIVGNVAKTRKHTAF